MDNYMEKEIDKLLEVLAEYKRLDIANQIDYQKFYLYSLITHSTAIEGSTVTELENQLLFDDGIPASGKPMVEQLMNLDLKRAYDMIDKTRDAESSKRSRVNVGTVCVLMMDVYAWIHAYDLVIQVKEQLINTLDESQWRYLTPGGDNFSLEWRKMFFETTASEASPEVYVRMAYDRYGNGNNNALGYFASNASSKLEVSQSLQSAYASSDKRGGSTQWQHLNGAKRLTKKFWDDDTIFSGDGRVD